MCASVSVCAMYLEQMTYSSKVQSWDTRMRLSARRVSLNCQVINNIHNHSITVLDISNRHWPPSVKKATAFTQESVARWRKDEVAGEFPSGTWDGIWPQRNYAINTSLRTKGDYWLTEVHLYVKTLSHTIILLSSLSEKSTFLTYCGVCYFNFVTALACI